MKEYKFKKDELWSYDPFHIISKIRQANTLATYKHISKPNLETFANQEFYQNEIDNNWSIIKSWERFSY